MENRLVLTCEHAGNSVPENYSGVFARDVSLLKTHRGYDIGALELARTIGRQCGVKPYLHTVTRLLVDLNRSLHNPAAFSEYVQDFKRGEREELVLRYYHPHRDRVEEEVRNHLDAGDRVIHLSVHTFTPVLNGNERNADVGLLYDPSREAEKTFCSAWKEAILRERADLVVRFNYPYRGIMDGFSTWMKKRYRERNYLGLELEVNQKFPAAGEDAAWRDVQEAMGASLLETLRNEMDSKGRTV